MTRGRIILVGMLCTTAVVVRTHSLRNTVGRRRTIRIVKGVGIVRVINYIARSAL